LGSPFFFFPSWPTIHTNNSPIGLINFYFYFVHGLQSAPFQFLARCQAQKKKKRIIPFSVSAQVSLHHRLSPVACQPLVSFGSNHQSSPPASVFYFQTQASKIFHLEFEE